MSLSSLIRYLHNRRTVSQGIDFIEFLIILTASSTFQLTPSLLVFLQQSFLTVKSIFLWAQALGNNMGWKKTDIHSSSIKLFTIFEWWVGALSRINNHFLTSVLISSWMKLFESLEKICKRFSFDRRDELA